LNCACRIANSFLIQGAASLRPRMEDVMRAEIQNIVDEIKQSVVLLRRHL
jgi:hypothetical protein